MAGQEGFERVAQKQRTRNALLQAARELLSEGKQPTVPEAADRAGISRATAYRYFSKHDEMALEAVLDAVAAEFERLDLDMADVADPAERAAHVVAAVLSMVLRNETLFRSYLSRSAAGEAPAPRGGRRLRWIHEALKPIKTLLPHDRFQRLVHGVALVCGIETVIVLKDICGLEAKTIEQTASWVAKALVAAAISEPDTSPRTG